MKKKRLIAAISAIAVVTTMLMGCGSEKKDNTASTSSAKKYSFGMATDQGGLGDKSFNDAANKGLEDIKSKEADHVKAIHVLESKQEENYEPNLRQLAKTNDLTVGVGFLMKDALEKVAKDNPNKNFVLIDEVSELSNVKSLTFKSEEGSFLMGVIAGKTTKTNKVGFIGGMESDLIKSFEAGYIAGVKAVNPKAAEDLISRKTVKYAGSFSDSGKGYELAKSLYNDGCDVIYHAAGATGLGMFKAAKETTTDSNKHWAIGVDQDQAVTNASYKDVILSSMLKKVDVATEAACKEVIDGKFKAGTSVYGLKDGAVDMADSTKDNTPQDVIDLANKYKQAIIDGKFTVPSKIEDVKDFTAPEVK